MLLKVHDDPSTPSGNRLENMHIAYFPELALFTGHLDAEKEALKIEFRPPPECTSKSRASLDIPLDPDVRGLDKIQVTMHQSPTVAYDMGEAYNCWFSERLGYRVIFAYVGKNRRPVLGNVSPKAASKGRSVAAPASTPPRPSIKIIVASFAVIAASLYWSLPYGLSRIAAPIVFIYLLIKFTCGQDKLLSDRLKTLQSYLIPSNLEDEGLTFSDVAPYLIVTSTSLSHVSSLLPSGQSMDIRKFRPNIIISNASQAYDEDFWGEITVSGASIILTQNCARCQSINVDFETGKPGTDEHGTMLKRLMKDRRVDKGTKYSPVFGRYGFLISKGDGTAIKVGDEVTVSKRNKERTTFGQSRKCPFEEVKLI